MGPSGIPQDRYVYGLEMCISGGLTHAKVTSSAWLPLLSFFISHRSRPCFFYSFSQFPFLSHSLSLSLFILAPMGIRAIREQMPHLQTISTLRFSASFLIHPYSFICNDTLACEKIRKCNELFRSSSYRILMSIVIVSFILFKPIPVQNHYAVHRLHRLHYKCQQNNKVDST